MEPRKRSTEPYYISSFTVKNLWGYKNYDITLFKDVNVIIGPNASGKTTLINLLYDILSGNFTRLSRTDVGEVSITVKAFKGTKTQTISVKQSDGMLHYRIGTKDYELSHEFIQHFQNRELPTRLLRGRFGGDASELLDQLRGLVPAVWLPVSRRLPIAEEEEMARRSLHRKPLESVDECLASLLEELQRYRLSLNVELSEMRKEFQRRALENILYDKQHDRRVLRQLGTMPPPTDEDRTRLIQAFEDVGLSNPRLLARIDEHFKVAREAIEKQRQHPGHYELEELLILPLIARTRTMVDDAQSLEAERTQLFLAIRQYEAMVNSFVHYKKIAVSDRGELAITPDKQHRGVLEWRHLSSGEKQILILLTQALLSGRSPMVYVADEPELSLHVIWQEKLLHALTKIAGQCQFIVATHSPDIASGFGDRVIDLELV